MESFHSFDPFCDPQSHDNCEKTEAPKAGLFLEALADIDEFENAFAEVFAVLFIELLTGT